MATFILGKTGFHVKSGNKSIAWGENPVNAARDGGLKFRKYTEGKPPKGSKSLDAVSEFRHYMKAAEKEANAPDDKGLQGKTDKTLALLRKILTVKPKATKATKVKATKATKATKVKASSKKK